MDKKELISRISHSIGDSSFLDLWRMLSTLLLPLLPGPWIFEECWVLFYCHYSQVLGSLKNIEYSFIAITPQVLGSLKNIEYSFIAITPRSLDLWRMLSTLLLPLLPGPWIFEECWVLFYCHYSQVHLDPKWVVTIVLVIYVFNRTSVPDITVNCIWWWASILELWGIWSTTSAWCY